MFYLLKSNKAFNRTSAHPADSAVRIAHHEDDLAALHYRNKIRAIIFKRALSADVIADMRRYGQMMQMTKSRANTADDVYTQRGPGIKISPFGTTYDKSPLPDDLRTCTALIADIVRVSEIFARASGALRFSAHPFIPLTEWFMDINNEETRRNNFWKLEPHLDGTFNDRRRLTCAYAEDVKDMGTGWFPGAFNVEESRAISKEYLTAKNPDDVLKKYNYQTTDAGDLCFFHTQFPDRHTEKAKLGWLHKSPVPPIHKPRLCLLLPT